MGSCNSVTPSPIPTNVGNHHICTHTQKNYYVKSFFMYIFDIVFISSFWMSHFLVFEGGGGGGGGVGLIACGSTDLLDSHELIFEGKPSLSNAMQFTESSLQRFVTLGTELSDDFIFSLLLGINEVTNCFGRRCLFTVPP